MNKLKDARKSMGMSQDDLAKKSGVPIRRIQGYEYGKQGGINGAAAYTVYKLAKAMDCSMESLLEIEEE